MLRTILFMSVLVVAFAPQGSAPPIRPSPISMTIAAGKETVTTGAPIVVKIKLKNITDHDVTISYRGPYQTFELIVLDAKGGFVPDTEFGDQMRHKGPFDISGMNIVTTLKPDQSWDGASITPTELRVMTHPGKYSIQVTGDLGRFVIANAVGIVKSNKIVVAVTE